MDAKTLTALKESIAHWRRMATGTAAPDEEPTGDHCALCNLFNNRGSESTDRDCYGCPVYEREGGEHLCGNSPYQDALDRCRFAGKDSPEFKTAAQAELDFLISLLPEGETA